MSREASLPVQFQALSSKVHYVRRKTANEYSSSCPKCGGVVHQDGSPPDRFVMWIVSKHGLPLGFCRACGYIWTPKNERPPSREEFEQWRRQQIAIETQRKEEAERAIALLRSEKIWEFYHNNQGEYGAEFWLGRGINQQWQEHWKLGMYGNYHLAPDYSSPAATIPIWQEDGEVSNVKLRVVKPRDNTERYRSLYKTGQANLFFALPATDTKCLVVEGEIKAMVCAMYTSSDMQIIGLPSKTPEKAALTALDKYGAVVVALDPDARIEDKQGVNAERELIDFLGKKRCSYIHLPGKLDDLILKHGLNLEAAIKVAKAA